MKWQGGRESKNVDDITKQKKRVRTGVAAFAASEGLGHKEKVSRNSTMSGVISDRRKVNSPALKQKSGMNSMESAATRDAENIKNLRDEKKTMEDLLDKAFSPEKKSGGAAGYDKLAEAKAPTQLKEIWTPRPLKK